jgi:hypothetical protein
VHACVSLVLLYHFLAVEPDPFTHVKKNSGSGGDENGDGFDMSVFEETESTTGKKGSDKAKPFK